MPNILLTIAARGGSKGVKGKNLRPLLGKPLIAHTIEQALQWGKAKQVVVTTDSPDIARIAKDYGAQVPFLRPVELADDHAAKGPVLQHALLNCERIFKEQFDVVVDLDPTCPMRSAEDLDHCLDIFLKDKPKTLFSVVAAHKNPYFNMVELKENGNYELCKKFDKPFYCRQDAPKVYAMNASIYLYERDFLLKTAVPSPFSDRTRIYVMNEDCGIDIDREVDFRLVEFLFKEKLVER